jgi:hypothetical protein
MGGSAGTVFLWVASVVLVILGILVGRLLVQLRRTLMDVGQLTRSLNGDILPRVERTLDEVTPVIAELRGMAESVRELTERTSGIVGTAEGIVAKAQAAVNPILDKISELAGPLNRGAAVLSGFRAGWGALRRGRHEKRLPASE